MQSKADAHRLLTRLGAPPRLLLHAQLVGEAAAELAAGLARLGLPFDAALVELRAALHDAGKIAHPAELDQPGSRHEPAGETLLLANGVPASVAQCCVSHAAWHEPGVSFEERLVALADKLWKGKREEALELLVIDEAASKLGADRWDLFARLDSLFEEVASTGPERLHRSNPSIPARAASLRR